MSQTLERLERRLEVVSSPEALLYLANQPLLAPRYLNFVTDIVPLEREMSDVVGHHYDVGIRYRVVLATRGIVHHHYDGDKQTITLRHDGKLAQFVATFGVSQGAVTLVCDYQTKVPLVTWLVGRLLDRAIHQAASAMDRYAACLVTSPT